MTNEYLIAGFGGQGLLFAGKFLVNKGMMEGKEVSWLPSYGPEMRGGTANCSVIISDDPVGSPIVSKPNVLMVMNLPSLDKYENDVKAGGKMAPTSLPGQVTQTSPYGRDVKACGFPIRVCEMLATLDGPEYLERVAVNNVKNIKAAKKAIKKAFQNQVEGKGFSLVEVISSCPTNWGMTPQKALEWIDEKMIPHYPLGVYKDRSAAKED